MKKVIIIIFIAVIIFFAFYRRPGINLEGKWIAKEIIFDGKTFYSIKTIEKDSFSIENYIDVPAPTVYINDYVDSMYISNYESSIRAGIKIKYDNNGKAYAVLSSKEKSLNGKFDIQIDTLRILSRTPKSSTIDIRLKSHSAYLRFYQVFHERQIKDKFVPIQKGRP